MINVYTPKKWEEYELIDCGDFEKLERFGNYTLRRPEPQAIWKKVYNEKFWKEKTDILFVPGSSHKGEWQIKGKADNSWVLNYPLKNKVLKLRLNLTAFKHVGVFPEQAVNWDFIFENIQHIKKQIPVPKVLNLFAYTGGASLAARAAGADVTHVDSVKQVVNWANTNQGLSGLKDIRWVVEDAMKFAEREAKRGHVYHGIILDPPAYGIGTNGERWKLEEKIDALLSTLSKILHPEFKFLILNCYSLGLSCFIVKNLLERNFKNIGQLETGEMVLNARSGVILPLGVVGRMK
ncbi:MAG: class I SAM-dependent methyltransferase [Flavobacteriales bacterium]|nr:class I SAM-dependent methyltransferase [Flavobacteriales bacterium]